MKHPGGHSSVPSKDNAIYRLSQGLAKLAQFDFPVRLNETTRILPGEPVEKVLRTLVRVLADEKISVMATTSPVLSDPSPLNPEILQAIEKLTNEFWPGIPVIPTMSTGATDGS